MHRQAANGIKRVRNPDINIAARQQALDKSRIMVFEWKIFVKKGTPNCAIMPQTPNEARKIPMVAGVIFKISTLNVWKPMIIVNCAIVSKKPINIAVPITGRFSVVTKEPNLNLLLRLSRVFRSVGLVSFKRNKVQSVPMSEIPAAKKKGAWGLILLNKPPTSGPITKPNANAELKIPKRFARFCGVAVSATMACATEILPPVSPSSIRAANKIHKALASANSRKEKQVPARLMAKRGFRPHLSESDPKTGVAKNCATEKDAVKTPSVVPVRPKVLPYSYITGTIMPKPNELIMQTNTKTQRFLSVFMSRVYGNDNLNQQKRF